ncbi:TetR/AcrR family transcriptional regulator [Streptococcus sp. DD12]|uniref:TetR/AcrR family transcriptional regulator n=1 Tax=Streptococcus sp. DD12 TaxID=1777880 RepID=UPI0007994A5E|nr:TetR family transcriptional regulator [Streptococcus sp. DD12]KXT75655.1 Transcriptional regulator, TetR family [Streptococcus sp. DD12]
MKKMSETEEKIIQLGTAFIQSRGVNGFSYAEISTAMGIRKASIHYYFPKKQDLIARVLEVYNQDFKASLDAIRARGEDFSQSLEAFIQLYRRNLESGNICLCSMLATEQYALTEAINQSVQEFFQCNTDWLKSLFEDEGLVSQLAEDFFATVQGAQLITKASGDLSYFDQLLTDKLARLTKK